jgi:alcohol dehydrogenase
MSKASHLSGKAINITKTTAPHAISYPITTYFGLQHGHAVALTLGKFFIINSNVANIIDPRGAEYLKNTMSELCKMFNVSSPVECKNKWYDLMRSIDLESSMKNIGIESKSQIDKIIRNINVQRLNNNPVRLVVVMNTVILQLHNMKNYENNLFLRIHWVKLPAHIFFKC